MCQNPSIKTWTTHRNKWLLYKLKYLIWIRIFNSCKGEWAEEGQWSGAEKLCLGKDSPVKDTARNVQHIWPCSYFHEHFWYWKEEGKTVFSVFLGKHIKKSQLKIFRGRCLASLVKWNTQWEMTSHTRMAKSKRQMILSVDKDVANWSLHNTLLAEM